MNDNSIELLKIALEKFKVGKITLNRRDHNEDCDAELYDIWYNELKMILRNYDLKLIDSPKHASQFNKHKVVRFGEIEPDW